MKEKLLYIIAGANGSGKTTLAELLLEAKDLEFLNADEIAKEIAPDAMDKVLISAGKEYLRRRNEFLDKEKSFAAETTLAGQNIDNLISKARERNYKIVLVYIYLSKFTTCIKRVKTRVENGGHNVPPEDITRRYFRSVVNFWDKYKGIVDEWSLFYNGEEYNPISVADGNREICDIIEKDLYENFLQVVKIAKDEIKIVQ